jgi:AraC-like DNA-binding protein
MTADRNALGDAAPASGTPRMLSEQAAHQGFMRQNIDLDVVNRSPSGKRFAVIVRNYGAVRIASIDPAAASFIRGRKHLADGKDILSIVISRGGCFSVDGAEGDASCGARGAAVLESRRESVLHSPDETPVWTICMDRTPLEPLLSDVRQPLQRCLHRDNPGLSLLSGYLNALCDLDTACEAALVSRQICDLTLYALGVTGDAQAIVRERGVKEARLRSVLGQLAQASADARLDPAQFAERLNVSVRYLHRLLEPSGRSFSAHLLQIRLERAAAMLRDRSLAHLKIGQIAAKAGFGDISHFNRSFRQTFADTPKGFRARGGEAAWRAA